MIQLAFDLGMQLAQPTIWSALQSDCCTASGVTCDGNQRVTYIYWYRIGLNGTINGTAIPSSVTNLDLYGNNVTGNVPNALPSGLLILYLDFNQMSGDLPSFPSTLRHLSLGYPGQPGNHFTGTLRLNRPIELWINDNWITDVVIQDGSVLATSGYYCDLSNNPLLGNPNILGLTRCFKNGLYSAERNTLTTETTTSALTTNTAPGYITAQQMSSRKVSVTGRITTLELTSSMATVQFSQELREFAVNLGMMVLVLISAMFLTAAFMKTPFMREFKRIHRTTTSAPEF